MAKKNDFVLIKSKFDLKKAFENRNVKQYALAPDFNVDMIWLEDQKPYLAYADFIQRLIDNTAEINNQANMVEIFNKIMKSVKDKWVVDSDYYVPALKEIVRSGKSVWKFLQNFVYGKSSIKTFDNKFKKSVHPDNQIVFNLTGVDCYIYYNFSGARFDDVRLVESVLPNENQQKTKDDILLMEKYERDFVPKTIDLKKLFPGAKNPELLYDLRRGKIDASVAMVLIDKADFKFVRPGQDFVTLDANELYEIMVKPGLNWDAGQVRAIMNLIIEKADADIFYFEEIMKVIDANKHIFLTKNDDNLKLWVKLESKFEKVIKDSKENAAEIKKLLDASRKILNDDSQALSNLVNVKEKYMVSETRGLMNISGRIEEFLRMADGNDFFVGQAKKLKDVYADFLKTGNSIVIEIPKKPWKLFAFEKEKALYAELVDLINNFNNFISDAVEERIRLFGEHRFDANVKRQKIGMDIEKLIHEIADWESSVKPYENWDESKAVGNVAEMEVKEQKVAKQKRFEAAKKKMQEKGIVAGQKSGVVKADALARDIRLENKVKQLRLQKKYADMTDAELKKMAAGMLFGKSK